VTKAVVACLTSVVIFGFLKLPVRKAFTGIVSNFLASVGFYFPI
jgi:hypothetical protein